MFERLEELNRKLISKEEFTNDEISLIGEIVMILDRKSYQQIHNMAPICREVDNALVMGYIGGEGRRNRETVSTNAFKVGLDHLDTVVKSISVVPTTETCPTCGRTHTSVR